MVNLFEYVLPSSHSREKCKWSVCLVTFFLVSFLSMQQLLFDHPALWHAAATVFVSLATLLYCLTESESRLLVLFCLIAAGSLSLLAPSQQIPPHCPSAHIKGVVSTLVALTVTALTPSTATVTGSVSLSTSLLLG